MTELWKKDRLSCRKMLHRDPRTVLAVETSSAPLLAQNATEATPKHLLPAKFTLADYHGSMNAKHYEEWARKHFQIVREKYPPDKYEIQFVLDNASYHVARVNGQLTLSELNTKAKLADAVMAMGKRGWSRDQLMQRKTKNGGGVSNAELKRWLQEDGYAPERFIDKLAEEYKIELAFLPPNHPELNPIEKAWGVAKGYVSRNNTTRKFLDVKTLLLEGFDTVTPEIWAKMVAKAEVVEEGYWKRYMEENMVIRIDEDDDDDMHAPLWRDRRAADLDMFDDGDFVFDPDDMARDDDLEEIPADDEGDEEQERLDQEERDAEEAEDDEVNAFLELSDETWTRIQESRLLPGLTTTQIDFEDSK
jgi:hypothetical protein